MCRAQHAVWFERTVGCADHVTCPMPNIVCCHHLKSNLVEVRARMGCDEPYMRSSRIMPADVGHYSPWIVLSPGAHGPSPLHASMCFVGAQHVWLLDLCTGEMLDQIAHDVDPSYVNCYDLHFDPEHRVLYVCKPGDLVAEAFQL